MGKVPMLPTNGPIIGLSPMASAFLEAERTRWIGRSHCRFCSGDVIPRSQGDLDGTCNDRVCLGKAAGDMLRRLFEACEHSGDGR